MTRGTKVYLFGLGCLGLTIGLIVGLSQSSISGTVLTALFALIGAGAIFYVPWSNTAAGSVTGGATETEEGASHPPAEDVKEAAVQADKEATEAAAKSAAETGDKEAAAPADKEAAAAPDKEAGTMAPVGNTVPVNDPFLAPGAALIVFSLTLAIAMIYGSVVRTNGSLGDFWPYRETVTIPPGLSASATLDAVVLDRLMVRLGIDSTARNAVLAKLTACRGVSETLTAATIGAYAAVEPLQARESARLSLLVPTTMALRDKLVSGGPAAAGGEAIDGTYRSEAIAVLNEVSRFKTDEAGWLAGQPAVATAIDALEASLEEAVDCEPSSTVVNEFVKTLKELQNTPLSGEALVERERGIENIGTVQMY